MLRKAPHSGAFFLALRLDLSLLGRPVACSLVLLRTTIAQQLCSESTCTFLHGGSRYHGGMGYAILRLQKLKAGVSVQRSLKHAFREQDTPNADPARLGANTHIGAANVEEAMQRFQERLPAKVRSNAVLAVEFLVTGSPDAMAGKTRAEQDAYLHDALSWLQKRHGAENVVYAGIHRDETTPHLYAYVVPIDERGKLNCRAFYGGAAALREMQTEFADRVGRKHGLERGIEGSKATHQRVQRHYGALSKAEPVALIDAPEPTLADRVNPMAYGQRVAQAVIDQVQPERNALLARVATADADRRRAAEMQATAQAAQRDLAKSREHVTKLEQALAPFRKLHALSAAAVQEIYQQVQDKTAALRAEKAKSRPDPAHKPSGMER